MDEIDNLLARDTDPRFGIGGNQPPLIETLAEVAAPLMTRAAYLLHGNGNGKRGFDGFPAELDTDTADLAPAFAKQLNEHAKVLEEAHRHAKLPYLEAGRIVDNFFLPMARQLHEAAKMVNRRLLAWRNAQIEPQQIVRSSFGPSASVRKTIGWKVTDAAKIPRKFLKPDPLVIGMHAKLAAPGELPKAVPGLAFFFEEQMISR